MYYSHCVFHRKNIPGTKFEALAPYLASHNVLITSRNPEEADFRKLPAVLRKMPEFILLGNIYIFNIFALKFDNLYKFE